MTDLNLTERVLLEGKISGLVLACHEGERPLRGMLGLIDWRFHGVFSRFVESGKITGKPGECVYVAAEKGGKTFHFIVAGAGPLGEKQKRGEMPAVTLTALKKNILGLKFEKMAIAPSDVSKSLEKWANQELKGKLVWIAQ